MKKIIAALLFSTLLAGCAGGAAPNLYNGRYYIAGDKSCKRMSDLGDGRIMCYDKKGNQMGWRRAMTAEDIQMYRLVQEQHAREMVELSQQLDQTGRSITGNLNTLTQQYQSYTPPAVAPIGQPSTTVKCINNGVTVICKK